VVVQSEALPLRGHASALEGGGAMKEYRLWMVAIFALLLSAACSKGVAGLSGIPTTRPTGVGASASGVVGEVFAESYCSPGSGCGAETYPVKGDVVALPLSDQSRAAQAEARGRFGFESDRQDIGAKRRVHSSGDLVYLLRKGERVELPGPPRHLLQPVEAQAMSLAPPGVLAKDKPDSPLEVWRHGFKSR